MSQINNVSANNPIQQIVANPIQKQLPAQSPAPATDQVEISAASHFLQVLKTNDVRGGKIAEIRQQIENGTYDADGSKLDAAAGALLDELNQL
jgi:anti-sigma28 factor (negative regulator of flagellin synthesis)